MGQDRRGYLVERADTLLPFLLRRAGGGRNHIKALLSRRQVAVDGQVQTRFDHPLAPGQQVEILTRGKEERPLPFSILYEDGDVIAINKPAGLLTVSTGDGRERTAYRALTGYVRQADPGARIFVVHRLDRDTSGVVLFARHERAKRALQDNWGEVVRLRGYAAVVEGRPEREEGTIRSWLRETSTHLVYSTGYGGGGKEAVTRYRTRCSSGRYALLDVELDTGRKNQIRVHMQDIGHPVAGDRKYGARTSPLGRLCLHAGTLIIQDPLSGREQVFSAAEPPDFARLCGGDRPGKQNQ